MKISVIITSYNYKSFVVQAINSAMAQTYSPWEVIVVDDGSSDGTVDLLYDQRYDEAIVRIISKANGGQLSAFREGYNHASGDVIAFLDADDYWDAGYLKRLNELFSAEKSVDFVMANLRYFGGRTGQLRGRLGIPLQDEDLRTTCSVVALSDQPRWIGSPTSAISVRRRHLEDILKIPSAFDDDWRIQADDVLVIGSSILGGHKYRINQLYVNYRVHGANGWYDKKLDAVSLVKFQLRSERMMRWFKAAAFGAQRPSYLLVFYEFKSDPKPGLRDLGSFCRMMCRAEGGAFRKLKAMIMMSNHWRRSREVPLA